MQNDRGPDHSLHRAAHHLVTGAALLGIMACLAGWLQGGSIGFAVGVLVTWSGFLLGLLALHTLSVRAPLAAPAVADYEDELLGTTDAPL